MSARTPHIAPSNGRFMHVLLGPQSMQLLADLIGLALSFALYQVVRSWSLTDVRSFALVDHASVAVISCLYWTLVFWMGGLYRDFYIRSPLDEISAVFRMTFIGSAVIFLAIYTTSSLGVRPVFVVYWTVLFFLITFGRLVARHVQGRLREVRLIRIPTLVVGTVQRVTDLIDDLKNEPAWGYDVRGVVLLDVSPRPEVISGFPVVGGMDDLRSAILGGKIRDVLISLDAADHDRLLNLTAETAELGCTVKIVPDLYEIFSGQARTHQIYGSPLIDVSPQLMQPWEEIAKRAADIIVSALVLGIGAPVWASVGLLVKLTSPGPMFFVQDRVGRNGRVFRMAKFRSMTVDDKRGPTWTDKNDPRVTPFGRFIRKTHLDEIPQLWNVLKGEMSLVGPRPEQPFYVEKFTAMLPYYRRRHKVRPGVTGWWQVKAKSNPESLEEIQQRLRYDFFYIENMSFKLDLEIMVRTVFVMLKGHGKA